MEQEEQEIIRKLQYSQNVHENMQKELNKIMHMKAKDYIQNMEG